MSNDKVELETPVLIGNVFKQAREQLGLQIDDLAQELHILPFFIRALEDDNFEKMTHGPTFIKGYMRTYGARLGIDAEPLIVKYVLKTEPAKKRNKFIPSHRPAKAMVVGESKVSKWLKKILSLSILIAILIGGFFIVKEHGWLSASQEPAPNNVAPLKLSAETPVPELSDNPYSDNPVNEEESDIVDSSPNNEHTLEAHSELVENPITETADKGDVLLFELNDDSWIEVRDASGSKIYADLARRDSRVVLSGAAPFSVILGNGKAVSVTFNNRAITFSFGRNNYAEFSVE